ncbi:hypothetical protein OH146_05005 [Salinibacterium sp. SYSU T00001]|nr:hypothetical protein [Salinibacterium sedimenticola]MCW4385131.1 hypothetical protein [Salinibacterium sedimenticola]
MTTRNGARGAVTFWSWAVVTVSLVLFVGWAYTVFVGSLFIEG